MKLWYMTSDTMSCLASLYDKKYLSIGCLEHHLVSLGKHLLLLWLEMAS